MNPEGINDSKEFETFRVLDKWQKHPDKLTLAEKAILHALGLDVE